MERQDPPGRSYWDHFATAQQALEEGNLPLAERSFLLARQRREDSPGRVFLTEKISDGLNRLMRGGEADGSRLGRWGRRAHRFQKDFLARSEKVVREAVRLAELRPEDAAEANQPILETALFLVGRSSIFAEEPASAVPLLKGIFRTAGKSGRPFDVQLIRHDIPLTEEDRLWLARKGPEVLEEFVANDALAPGSAESVAWVHIILQLLHPRYFGSTSRLEEERAWLEAMTTDRLLCRSDESVELYRRYLEVNSEPGTRPDQARVRLLELLANVDGAHFPVPRYALALGAMQAAGLAEGSEMSGRFQHALERIEYRRPDPEPGTEGFAWASVGLEADGRVAIVYWWRDQPRDVAYWQAGDDPAPLAEFLEPCGSRILAADAEVVTAVGNSWPEVPPPWAVGDFATALLEPLLPETGQLNRTLLQIGLGETGPWRQGWRADLGHELLEPPRRSDLLEAWGGGSGGGALLGGLIWLGIQARINRGDPALRAGIGAMAGRGDPAASFLYDFLVLDEGLTQTVDSSFEPWTLPLLWTRPDPLGWMTKGDNGTAAGPREGEEPVRPDLGSNNLAVVTTGDTPAVLAAWGDGSSVGKWRVVLDRLDRLPDLAVIAGRVAGPVTLIPAQGKVHGLRPALDLLNTMLGRQGRPAGRFDGLLPLFHWVRLVESHNGDLLDFRQFRPRPRGEPELYGRYAALLGDLPRYSPTLEDERSTGEGTPEPDPWAQQFAQRVRRAGLVAGLGDCLTLDPHELDALWGVFEGSGVSWVFLDSAAVHWYLYGRPGVAIGDLHELLFSRGDRHLSLLTGAMWRRSELEDLLATWLHVYGSPYCLALSNAQPPVLRLADGGVAPDAELLAVEAHAACVAQVSHSLEQAGGGTVLLPRFGTQARFWRAVASGELDLADPRWSFLDTQAGQVAALPGHTVGGGAGLLVVPLLDSLTGEAAPIAQEDTPEAWQLADEEREQYLRWRRRLCGLELAGLLAGPWDGVEILDTRWWRLLAPVASEADDGGERTGPWTGRSALAEACPHGCRLFDLPGVSAQVGVSIHPNIMEKVRQWLSAKGLAGEAARSRGSAEPVALPDQGAFLVQECSEIIWDSLLQALTMGWERGQLDSWLLLVSSRVPDSAAAVVAAGFAPGVSVWNGTREAEPPAPVLWCRPADLLDGRLVRFLAAHPPWTVLVDDLQDWLPLSHTAAQGGGSGTGVRPDQGAAALRQLMLSPARRLVLQSRPLTDPWRQYLAAQGDVVLLDSPVKDGGHTATGDPSDHTSPSSWSPPSAIIAGGLSLLPDVGADTDPRVTLRRLRHLLAQLRPALLGAGEKEGQNTGPALARDQLVSLDQLAILGGIGPEAIAGSVRVLRWAARLAGEFLSDAGAGAANHPAGRLVDPAAARGGHTLLVTRRFAEIEHTLVTLEEQIKVLLPLLLGEVEPGCPVWLDLEFSPAQFSPRDLQRLDTFLCGVGRLSEGDSGLLYLCPRGSLQSTRRLVMARRSLADVLDELSRGLDLFRRRLAEVMDAAVETGDGFLVETGLSTLRREEEEFLALGSAMKMWRWAGPATAGALHLVDLLTVAESPTVQQGGPGWQLLAAELNEQAALAAAPGGAALSGSVPSTGLARDPGAAGPQPGDHRPRGGGGWRGLLSRRDRDETREIVLQRVAELVDPAGSAGLLVLSGLAGSGRHEALLAGLVRSWSQVGLSGHVTVHAPDTGSAAFFMQRWSQLGPAGPLPTVLVAAEGGGQGSPVPAASLLKDVGQPGSSDIIIMLESQRFPAELRYQIAQQGRGRRLLMTLDPGETSESWEHLFLTVPRAEQVMHLKTQHTLSRRVWTEIRNNLPAELTDKVQHQGPGKGLMLDVPADNLDHCLSRVVEAVESGELPPRLRLVGPLSSDLDFLAESLSRRGWLAVPEGIWEGLHLPGARELMVASVVFLAETLQLGRLQSLLLEAGAGPEKIPEPPGPRWASVLARMLGPEAAEQARLWLPQLQQLDPGITGAEFIRSLSRQPWAASVLADGAARRRALGLARLWGDRPLNSLPADDLWAAWVLWLGERQGLVGVADAGQEHVPGLPMVLLGPSDRHSGFPLSAGVYLCQGTEPADRHYRVFSRLTERVLILYKDRSPLAEGGMGP